MTRQAFLFMLLAPPKGMLFEELKLISGLEATEERRALELLVRLNLVELRGKLGKRRYTIHSLTRRFLEQQVIKWKK